jgi:hypothetical protein
MGMAGVGMGFTSIATLLIVQNSVEKTDLGVATSSHQFTRTLGGTVGIGICGSLVTARFARVADAECIGSSGHYTGCGNGPDPTELRKFLPSGCSAAVAARAQSAFCTTPSVTASSTSSGWR